MSDDDAPKRYVEAIRRSGLTIYDPIEIGNPDLWIPTSALEKLLNASLGGTSLAGLPLRTRSKTLKKHVCRALGYPVPSSFQKTRPRFPGQCFDIYIQKSNNLQVWNEELASTRRYAIVRIGDNGLILKVRVVVGRDLASLDATGTLTRKRQAKLLLGETNAELIAYKDTVLLQPLVQLGWPGFRFNGNPTDYPVAGQLLSIGGIFQRLQALVGGEFADAGHDQERRRGAELHKLVCQRLGYLDCQDDGRFPDLRHQLLEVKLQTSPTIDLGLIRPDSEEILDVPKIEGRQIRCCDVRYALFHGKTDGRRVTLTHLYLTTGEKFFSRFPQFRGNALNRKIQIPLPPDFFND